MHKAVIAVGALLVAMGSVPAGSVAALHVPPTLEVRTGAATMVEGRVLSISGSTFVMLSPAERVYCPPGAMCPFVIRAPQRYLVQDANAKIFGNYLGNLSLQDLNKGMDVVVYGTLSKSPTTGAAYSAPLPVPYAVLTASGIFVVGSGTSASICTGSAQSSSCSPGTYMPQTGQSSPSK